MSLFKLLFVVIILGLTACKPSNTVNAQLGSPEHIAGEFFQAIYNDKDLEKAQSMSTKEFANLIGSYGTARQVGRTLFNMSFDKVLINTWYVKSSQKCRCQICIKIYLYGNCSLLVMIMYAQTMYKC